MTARILIAGIGNIFRGDDGFGTEVARRLLARPYPADIQVVDIGIRGMDLAFLLLDGYDALILVDAVARGGPPGTLRLIEAESLGDVEHGIEAGRRAVEAHSMDPVKVLAFARALGAPPTRTLVVGCEPAALGGDGGDEPLMGLSPPVQMALDEAVRMVDGLVGALRGEPTPAPS